jgi:peroxiredoxin Q/BCP
MSHNASARLAEESTASENCFPDPFRSKILVQWKTFSATSNEERAMTVEEGKPAPDFTLEDISGGKVSLKDFRGKSVIVYFYPKDDTPGCTKEACGFRDLWKEVQDLDAVVLGISPDDVASHRKFAAKYELPFTLLCDPEKEVMTEYGAYGEKTMYGKKTVGVIRSTVWVGPDGKIRKHWKKVTKAANHPAKVLEALQAGR